MAEAAWLKQMGAWWRGLTHQAREGSIEALREGLRRSMPLAEAPAPEMTAIAPVAIPAGPEHPGRLIAARLYTPFAAGVAPAAGMVFLHGGGFVAGDLDTHDALARRLAAGARMRVLSVDYARAPEHPFPRAYDDALAAFDWLKGREGAAATGIDPKRIMVAGDSAGGNLAAGVALARRRFQGPSAQLLIYPWMQLVQSKADKPKVLEGHLLSTAIIEAARDQYLTRPEDAGDVRVSPLLAEDLSGVARAFIVTAGLDPLQHEARAYAERLMAAGVSAQLQHRADRPHGFWQLTRAFPDTLDDIADTAAALARAVG